MYTWLSLKSSADLVQLEAHLPCEYDPKRVAKKLAGGISDAVKAVLIEGDYVDKDYRSTYYHFYAKKGQRYRADCIRLHFFDQTVTFDGSALKLACPDGPEHLSDHYFGYMVLRPTGIATIGRSVLSPDIRSGAPRYIIFAEHKVHLLGYELAIQGFPSMDQHVDIAVCAHVACWAILRHYSQRYNMYKEFLTHDITLMAHQFDPGGLIPSRGLEVSHAERVFQVAGTYPVPVPLRANDPSFYRQLGAYLESGLPLFAAMSKHRHAVAVVGYEWRAPASTQLKGVRYAWDQVQALAFVDHNDLPYLRVPVNGGNHYSATDIDAFIVALPEKVHYPADAVDSLAQTLFKLAPVVALPPEDETIIRYFMSTGADLRCFVRERESEFDPKLVATIMSLPFAQYIWVVEFATETQWAVQQVAARAVIDATASFLEVMPLWLMHNRKQALVFDRRSLDPSSGSWALQLADTGQAGFTRMHRNLRPTRTK